MQARITQPYGRQRTTRRPRAHNGRANTPEIEPGYLHHGLVPHPELVVPAAASPKAPFPLSIVSVLGATGNCDGVFVLDGQLGRLSQHKQSPTDLFVEYGGIRQYIHFQASVEERLGETVRARLPSIWQWFSQAGARRYAELDGWSTPLSAVAVDRVDGFVAERLIPFIEEHVEEQGALEQQPSAFSFESVVDRVMPGLAGSFAFLAGRWMRLIPFFGRPRPGQPLLRVGNEYLVGIQSQPSAVAVATYDTALRDAVCAACAAAARDGDHSDTRSGGDLYRQEPYAVIRTPRGRCFVCQRLPPYVVEGMDKKLYYFDGAEIGIHVTTTQVQSVITCACVQVLHSYKHMFVGTLGTGNFICMPRDHSYYQALNREPLERALIEHLESARMTLCAGYQPVNSSVHRIQSVGRRTISLSEVRRRNLPVYWYYEPRRSARSKVMSMFV